MTLERRQKQCQRLIFVTSCYDSSNLTGQESNDLPTTKYANFIQNIQAGTIEKTSR